MDFLFQQSFDLKDFYKANRKKFESTLLTEAVNVREQIDQILRIGNVDLVNNAHHLVIYIMEGQDENLRVFAKQEGIAWATHAMELSFKLEWVQAIRRTLWNFIQKYTEFSNHYTVEEFFQLEKQINNRVDEFLNTFFIRYSTYKDSLIQAQKELVKNLSVPIIPINNSISILPLIGTIDHNRMTTLQEKVLTEIGRTHIQTLILDLSGVVDMETEEIYELKKIIDGAAMMGCHSVITGLRKEVVKKMAIELGTNIIQNTKTLATLQQALKEYLIS
ncbi:anti-anti-sigma regulatory factor [Salirhabdus euzebyi]|uniref:Anti-anti-sigma regulatory factor n=1 Tax=Salirhabdus euzebyi TaxID=394506 RepID=A0A841Q461_9BACI|nr:STAS domain-containing protein [Salirhabdus euzebyi]MBB6453177.1 anti-anti-sigma regulatory factor [Salirhabdus euzebyi]